MGEVEIGDTYWLFDEDNDEEEEKREEKRVEKFWEICLMEKTFKRRVIIRRK